MKKISTTAITVITLLALSFSAQSETSSKDAPIQHEPYTAIYQAMYKNFPLQATHRLEQSGDDWFFSSIASGFFGQIEENATFTYSKKGIIPKHYVYRRNVLGQNRETEITYNQKKHVAAGNKDSKPFTVPLKGGELDAGTYMLALADDIARGYEEPCYDVVSDDGSELFCFRVIGKEILKTALGKLDTIVVERLRKPNSPRHTQFWFAPSLHYAIAKLEHQEKKGSTAYSLEITYYKRDNGN